MEMYHFVTNWFFQAPIERAWEEIVDMKSWPTWWASRKKVAFRGSEPKLQLGSVVDHEVRGALPYTLRFTKQITAFQPPRLLGIKSSGDLVGTGKFVLEPRDNGTAVTHYWDVGTPNRLYSLLGKLSFVRAMLEKNHDYVMDEGYRGLKQRVEKDRTIHHTAYLDKFQGRVFPIRESGL